MNKKEKQKELLQMEQIMRYLQNGSTLKDAAILQKIPYRKILEWNKKGFNDCENDKNETIEALWYLGTQAAQIHFNQKCVQAITNAAEGKLTATEIKQTYATVPVYDEKGQHSRNQDGSIQIEKILQEETVLQKKLKPEWQAAAWLLEKLRREQFGKPNEIPENKRDNQTIENQNKIETHIQTLIQNQQKNENTHTE